MKRKTVTIDATRLNYLFQQACIIDMSALKPGNVGWHGAGHNMLGTEFMLSAAACGKALCRPGGTLGERILAAVQATQEVVACNTNLGIILLCAPVIQALEDLSERGGSLQRSVQDVLDGTTVADARQTFEAIRLARPGGMGQVEDSDISRQPEISLREAMELAVDRDMIAAEYCNGYKVLFQEIVPACIAFYARWHYHSWTATGVYLTLLGSYPDSLISRRHGLQVSEEITATVKALFADFINTKGEPHLFELQLLDFDRELKRRRVNPGTTADLVVAGFFISSLEKALREADSAKH